MNGGQGMIIGLGVLVVVGVGAALMFSGGDGPANDGGLGGTAVAPPATATATTSAPTPLTPAPQVGSGATLATARATHYDPANPPTQPEFKPLDYVCKRHVDQASSVTHVHDGTTYHFCGEDCLKKFKEDPVTILTKAALGE